jgi:hypothetical protein
MQRGSRMRLRNLVAPVIAAGMLVTMMATATAEQPATGAFAETWARTDQPVAEYVAERTWMWGPQAISGPVLEYYDEAPNGYRLVQYYDKSRMEITNPDGDQSSEWYVTNGLLAKEMVTGEAQLGDDNYYYLGAAEIPVAGDYDDADAPTYATFADKLYVPLGYGGAVIDTRIDRYGNTWTDDSVAYNNVYADVYVVETNHRVASVFWGFMNSYGTVYEDGFYYDDDLFSNPFYATGFPITEAYWASVKVGGVYRDVLMQCFERRCLTYTPDNPNGFEVEAGNIGLHYYVWRYGELPVAYQ